MAAVCLGLFHKLLEILSKSQAKINFMILGAVHILVSVDAHTSGGQRLASGTFFDHFPPLLF